ncbi:hypothetical protein [Paracoccus sphaerophysae]|uniref:hypothetical protein n=1 Tax=Paracoccus sphaerophysae TaxID=690417 RepID=UPI0012EB836D|nr:hypothetical protein [Paracoccus sphaerophysae]
MRKLSNPIVAVIACAFAFSSATAKELPPGAPKQAREPSDWHYQHRIQYLDLRALSTAAQMKAALDRRDGLAWTFLDAARYNTLKMRPGEYQSISQRHAYYDLISFVIEHDRNTPPDLRQIKFFHAATLVTTQLQLGAVELIDNFDHLGPLAGVAQAAAERCAPMSPETIQLLSEINKELFSVNMGVIKRLLFEWREPRDPREARPVNSVTPYQFDIAMVELEQATVERILRSKNLSERTRKELESTADNCLFRAWQVFNASSIAKPYLSSVGISSPRFTDVAHRKALGKAIVSKFHNKSTAEFAKIMGE